MADQSAQGHQRVLVTEGSHEEKVMDVFVQEEVVDTENVYVSPLAEEVEYYEDDGYNPALQDRFAVETDTVLAYPDAEPERLMMAYPGDGVVVDEVVDEIVDVDRIPIGEPRGIEIVEMDRNVGVPYPQYYDDVVPEEVEFRPQYAPEYRPEPCERFYETRHPYQESDVVIGPPVGEFPLRQENCNVSLEYETPVADVGERVRYEVIEEPVDTSDLLVLP